MPQLLPPLYLFCFTDKVLTVLQEQNNSHFPSAALSRGVMYPLPQPSGVMKDPIVVSILTTRLGNNL